MIIPVLCMNCGKLIADKWRFYEAKVKEARLDKDLKKVYFDGTGIPDTIEKKILDALGLKRQCCRKHFLTQVDLIDKI
jgi:DNA-directed RNA polymerase subunit N (RpoN/RPB10)